MFWAAISVLLLLTGCGRPNDPRANGLNSIETRAGMLGCDKISPTHYYNTIERPRDLEKTSHVIAVRVIIGRGFDPDETAEKFSPADLRCWRDRADAIAPYLLVGKVVGVYREVSITTKLTPAIVDSVVGDLLIVAGGHPCPEALEVEPARGCEAGLPEAQYLLGVIQRDFSPPSLQTYPKTYWMEQAAHADFRPAPVLLAEMKLNLKQ